MCSQSVRELVARVRAILRRRGAGVESGAQYNAGNLRMDLDRHEVLVNGHAVELTPKEFQILRQFLESPRRVFSRQEMLNRVWGEGYALEEHALDVAHSFAAAEDRAEPSQSDIPPHRPGRGLQAASLACVIHERFCCRSLSRKRWTCVDAVSRVKRQVRGVESVMGLPSRSAADVALRHG